MTRPIPEKGLKLLEQYFDLKVRNIDSPISRDELKEEIKDCAGVVTILTDKVDGEIMDLAPGLKIISNYAVGCDNVSIDEATKRGIKVGNTPDVLTQSSAEHGMALIMSLSKRIVEGDNIMRGNMFSGWGPMYMLGMELYKKTLGVIGYGRIGKRLADMMKAAFDCKIIYVDRGNCEKNDGNEKVDMDYLLQNADIVSINVPLCAETKHLIGEEQLNKMKKTALLINTARGPVVDEAALLKALKNKTIAGAAMDVFEFEPKRMEGLQDCKNLVMTPHVASATMEARSQMAEVAAQNVIGTLIEGQKPISILN